MNLSNLVLKDLDDGKKERLKFMAFYDEFRTYVEEHKLFPDMQCNLSHKIKYTRKKIKEGTLEDWKREMFEEIAGMRDMTIHPGGRMRKKVVHT